MMNSDDLFRAFREAQEEFDKMLDVAVGEAKAYAEANEIGEDALRVVVAELFEKGWKLVGANDDCIVVANGDPDQPDIINVGLAMIGINEMPDASGIVPRSAELVIESLELPFLKRTIGAVRRVYDVSPVVVPYIIRTKVVATEHPDGVDLSGVIEIAKAPSPWEEVNDNG